MKDLVLGGSLPEYCTWHAASKNVCYNKLGYHIYCNLFSCGVSVLKGCPEFIMIKQLLQQGAASAEIEKYAIMFILKHATADDLIEAIGCIKKESYLEGYAACQKDMRSILGF